MNKYQFKAKTSNNQIIRGIIEAQDINDLKKIINYHQYYLIKYRLIKDNQTAFIPVSIRRRDLVNFCQNMEMLLSSGINLNVAINIIKNSVSNIKLQNILSQAEKEVIQGKNLSESLSKYPKVFSSMMISMIRIGEMSNTLPCIFRCLTNYYKEMNSIKNKVINSLFYPSILVLVALIVVSVLTVFVIPMYGEIFVSSGVKIPHFTMLLLGFSRFIKNNLFYVILSSILLISVLILLVRSKMFKRITDYLLFNLIGLRNLSKKFYTYQFCISLSIMISSGMKVLDSIEKITKNIGNNHLQKKFLLITDEIKRGQNLSDALNSANYFPKMLIEMIKMGEISSNLQQGLDSCANYYFESIKNLLGKISVLVEPLLIVMISILVGGIMLAVFMPTLEMISSIG